MRCCRRFLWVGYPWLCPQKMGDSPVDGLLIGDREFSNQNPCHFPPKSRHIQPNSGVADPSQFASSPWVGSGISRPERKSLPSRGETTKPEDRLSSGAVDNPKVECFQLRCPTPSPALSLPTEFFEARKMAPPSAIHTRWSKKKWQADFGSVGNFWCRQHMALCMLQDVTGRVVLKACPWPHVEQVKGQILGVEARFKTIQLQFCDRQSWVAKNIWIRDLIKEGILSSGGLGCRHVATFRVWKFRSKGPQANRLTCTVDKK